MILTLQEVMDVCPDWMAFCKMKGVGEYAVNEGDGHTQVSLTTEEARELRIVVSRKILVKSRKL